MGGFSSGAPEAACNRIHLLPEAHSRVFELDQFIDCSGYFNMTIFRVAVSGPALRR